MEQPFLKHRQTFYKNQPQNSKPAKRSVTSGVFRTVSQKNPSVKEAYCGMTYSASLFETFYWLCKCLFACNHGRTEVNEGKCYCPDCGCGLIYQWILLRCQSCHARRESRYQLRQVIPAQSCCIQCGETAWSSEILETPAYFQLHTARLRVVEEKDFDDLLPSLYSNNVDCSRARRSGFLIAGNTFLTLMPKALLSERVKLV